MIKKLSESKKPDKRLRRLIELVGSCQRVIDIGTDHALLPITIAQEGRCDCVIAIDSSENAFKKAQRNIAEAEAGEKITPIHGQGLDKVGLKPGDTLVLAGLGGKEIISILTNKLPLPDNVSVIAQPQSDLTLVREFFDSNRWAFLAEEVIESRGRIYIIIKVSSNSSSGKVSDDSSSGKVSDDSSSGKVSDDSSSGKVSTDSSSGKVTADSSSGKVPADSSSGEVTADSSSDKVTADSSSGKVTADSSSGKVTADSSVSAQSLSAHRSLSILEKILGPLLLLEWGSRELTQAELRYLRREYSYRKSIVEPTEVDRAVSSYIESLLD